MKGKRKHEAVSLQKLAELQRSDLESSYKQPGEEVKKEQAEDCPEYYYPQAEEKERKKQAQECAQCFYQLEKPEAGGDNSWKREMAASLVWGSLLLFFISYLSYGGGMCVKLGELRTPGGDHLTCIVQEIVPGKQITMAHIICSPDPVIYQKLGLGPGVDYEYATMGVVTMTPSETAIIAADICMKKSAIEIGLIDHFSGTLIITGRMVGVSVVLESVPEYTETVTGLTAYNLTKV